MKELLTELRNKVLYLRNTDELSAKGELILLHKLNALEKQFAICGVSNCLLVEKIILALDDYGRKIHPVEYGLPIDPDTKDFEDKRPQEMLKIVTDILNGC